MTGPHTDEEEGGGENVKEGNEGSSDSEEGAGLPSGPSVPAGHAMILGPRNTFVVFGGTL